MRSAIEEAKVFEESVGEQLRGIVDAIGDKGTLQPEPEKSSFDLFGWIRGRVFQPDFLVQGPNNTVAVMVEAKSRPPMIYDVFRLKQARGGGSAVGLICVPDSQFLRINSSVREFAEEENVRLCPLSEVADVLKEILGNPEQTKTTEDSVQ